MTKTSVLMFVFGYVLADIIVKIIVYMAKY